jgi:hypothetical protein
MPQQIYAFVAKTGAAASCSINWFDDLSLEDSMPTDSETRAQIEDLFRGWIRALQQRDFAWFERHLADDYICTAHPFANFYLNKQAFIEADRKIAAIDADILTVLTHGVGRTILSTLVLRVNHEAHTADLGDGLPTAAEISAAVKGKTLAYASAWRFSGSCWQCYDHHLIGAVD